MSGFRFKRLEKYKIGSTRDGIELNIPFPKSSSGKIYRWCPNEKCTPRLFLIGDSHLLENIDVSKLRRPPGTQGITCPYCGTDADDYEFNYKGDIEAIKTYIAWAVKQDFEDYLKKLSKNYNRSQPKGSLTPLKMKFKSNHSLEPRVWREDLIRNLACDICGKDYGVYAIALFCPDCGCKNLHIHFEREIELILQQIDLAEQIAESGNAELSYRILGNSHEDAVTAFETYQKTCYRFIVGKSFSEEQAEKMVSKRAIGNHFQNIDRAKKLYENLPIDPFSVLTSDELKFLKFIIEKRHVIGHNLSIADEAYSDAEKREKPGTAVEIIADEISDFAKTAKKVILELEHLL